MDDTKTDAHEVYLVLDQGCAHEVQELGLFFRALRILYNFICKNVLKLGFE